MRYDKFWISSGYLKLEASRLPLLPGHTHNVNHEDCPAGEDRRKRLYISMTEDGTLLGYCHNCGGRGVVRGSGTSNIHIRSIPTKGFEPPALWISGNDMPTTSGFHIAEFREFVDRYKIDLNLAYQDKWRYEYDQSTRAMVFMFPCWDKDGKLCGVQIRYMLDKDTLKDRGLPKIKTAGHTTAHLFNPHDSDTCIVVEDRVSLLRVVEAGYGGLCMHGAKIVSGVEAAQLATLFDKIVVWYDNDNDSVNDIATQSLIRLKMFTSNAFRTYAVNDPKHHDVSTIVDLIGAQVA